MANPSLDAVHAARRANLRLLVDKFEGQRNLAQRLGCNRSYISQMVGKTPSKEISERTARAIETKLALQAGWLDVARVAE